jgi:uncharacterized protein YjiK
MRRFKFLAWPFYIVCVLFIFLISCKPKRFIYKSPAHYNFSTVLRDKLDLKIKEISGIVWDNQNDEFIAHNDEKGIIFYLDRDTKGIKRQFVFSETKGDFEDIAMAKKDIYVLRSDGKLFRIVTDSTGKQNTFDAGQLQSSGKNDFETLYYDAERKALVILCKNCSTDDKKVVSAYAYYPDSIGFDTKALFTIDTKMVDSLSPRPTSRFQPSAARIHPVLKKLFILSSASNQLVITDLNGNIENVYMLAKNLFPQAEGLTFKSNGDMYISNEGVSSKAELLKFPYIQ